MPRIKRTKNERIQFGIPFDSEDRLIALEELVKAMLATPAMSSINPDSKLDFENKQAQMDDLDIRFPEVH